METTAEKPVSRWSKYKSKKEVASTEKQEGQEAGQSASDTSTSKSKKTPTKMRKNGEDSWSAQESAVVKVVKHPYVKNLPSKKTEGAACYDVEANLTYPIWLAPGEHKAIPTGLSVSIPQGWELVVRARSGLALKGLLPLCGTIDSDYRGEIQVVLFNHGKDKVEIKRGDRIAQLALQKIYNIEWEVVESLDETERGEGGFGSTGV